MGKILAITTSFPNDTTHVAGRFIADWAVAMGNQGFDCTILGPPGSWAPTGIKRVSYGDPLKLLNGYGVPDQWSSQPIRTAIGGCIPIATMSHKAWSIVHQFDFLVGHWLIPSTLVALGAGRRKCTGVHGYAHGGDIAMLESLPPSMGRRLGRVIHKKLAGLTMVSDHLIHRFESVIDESVGSHVSVAPMGVSGALPDSDFAQYLLDRSDGLTVIATVGRLTAIKGLDVLMSALSKRGDVTWYAAGDGPLREELQATAQKDGINFVSLGSISPSQVAALLKVADIFVQPSRAIGYREEGTPVAVLEALSAPVATIVTDTGGLSKIADESGAKLVVPDCAKGLEEAIDFLVVNPAKRIEMAEKHTRFSTRFSWDTQGLKHAALLRESMARFNCGVPRPT